MAELILSGYAICWNDKAFIEEKNDIRFYEQFQRGAFLGSIATKKQKVLLFHKNHYEIEGDLTLLEDETGLAFSIELPDSSEGRFVYNLVKEGTISHVSIGFRNARVQMDEYRHYEYRLVKKADLDEISLVEVPAYKKSIVRTGCDHVTLSLLSKIDKSLRCV
ncbi:HK97 family phage prohead protease [Bacillus suaedae]|uniref:HK97 family phage prohead protease n=1 Tax=Halalkalibacter suaedae TaxID=2822140 RepID=A0A940WZ95_9BACI|nr:HK97 family phage prohead protease [Bacillus suaedae]MBP3953617.1 HK97 family phage prohead protease [Bacillus suaedae]